MDHKKKETAELPFLSGLSSLFGIFNKDLSKAALSKQELAKFLKTTPEALTEFEKAYQIHALSGPDPEEGLFGLNAKQAADMYRRDIDETAMNDIISRIVDELAAQTSIYAYDGKRVRKPHYPELPDKMAVTRSEIMAIPEEFRPQITGTLAQKDIKEPAYYALLTQYKMFLESKDPKARKFYYDHFRQGLDILDLDPVTYEILNMNQNSMGYWLPSLVEAVKAQDFFQIPATTVIKVPMTLLQLTRLEYASLTPTTLAIVDRFCQKVFELDKDKEYFIKTGTYSSKFDFRNCCVRDPKEVMEIGQYLLFIHFQANMMAGPLCQPCIYGVSTTNEWVVREYIPDKEHNPCIYMGLPLHTEYRVFVDFDTDELLGITPYWDPDVMKKRFGHEEDAESPHKIHDYVIYQMHEETLMRRYKENEQKVKKALMAMIPEVNLAGQWSVDIMQNGDDFYIIDMALAQNSALKECVPAGLLKKYEENWLPRIPDMGEEGK